MTLKSEHEGTNLQHTNINYGVNHALFVNSGANQTNPNDIEGGILPLEIAIGDVKHSLDSFLC